MLEPYEDSHYCQPREAPAWLKRASYTPPEPPPPPDSGKWDDLVTYIVGFFVIYAVLGKLGIL